MYSPELENKPTIEQMHELQKLGIVLAKEQRKLRKSRAHEKAHIFLPEKSSAPK